MTAGASNRDRYVESDNIIKFSLMKGLRPV